MSKLAEYIWIDGTEPVARMRSKTRVLLTGEVCDWNFDGSSTNQATGEDSDVLLKPVKTINDPFRQYGAVLVLCECRRHDGSAIESNTRAKLREVEHFDAGAWVGFEQEYQIISPATNRPLGFPAGSHFPPPQGPYYCGVDGDAVFGREIMEEHLQMCLVAGIQIYGTNAEVMPGQWEFQIGVRGNGEEASPMEMSDQLWLARYILFRVAEKHGCYISLDCKPVPGDWNGAGMHTNWSTYDMRDPEKGRGALDLAKLNLEEKHGLHIDVYGDGVKERLTGQHETCAWDEFRVGVADRGCSIRIPRAVDEKGYGYFEDRRPGANADPYLVCERMIRTLSGYED